MKRRFSYRGQNLTELALIIGVIGLVLIGMEVYFRRGMAGKIKDLTDGVIGSKQELFQQDTSGYSVNNSFSTMNIDTSTTYNTSLGGVKTTDTTENTVTSYNSIAQDY